VQGRSLLDSPGLTVEPPRFVRTSAWALIALVLTLAAISYYPFKWNPPHQVQNGVTRTASGALHFGDENFAKTAGPPAWFADAVEKNSLDVGLVVKPAARQRWNPVSIMMLARSSDHTNFTMGQAGTSLVVWFRRLGSDPNGAPPLLVPNVFSVGRWTTIRMLVNGNRLSIAANGIVRRASPLSSESLRTWDPSSRVAFGDELYGGRAWQGEIQRALVKTPAHTTDYMRPGGLVVPKSYFNGFEHWQPSLQPSLLTLEDVAVDLLHAVSFIPVGALFVRLRRPPLTVARATMCALALSLFLLLGKLLFNDRHLATADLVAETVGALVGATAARCLLERQRRRNRTLSAGPLAAGRTGSGVATASEGSGRGISSPGSK